VREPTEGVGDGGAVAGGVGELQVAELHLRLHGPQLLF
jgi:hypothetical protein